MSAERFDDVVVGAGIIGLAHAYHLAARGRRVVVFERNRAAQGASVRNFGMLWPIGQPAGTLRTLALRSREIWLDVLFRAGIWHERAGSLHVAYGDDEAQVLAEFACEARDSGFCCELLDPEAACAQSPFLRREGLRSALWSPHETCVDPRIVLSALPNWLALTLGVRFEFNRQITSCEPHSITAGGNRWRADRIWICSGDELQALFPETLQQQHLVRCKLQMMRSCPIPSRIGPMLAAGLTLLHYGAFDQCPTRPVLQARIDRELAEYRRYGIHVMVSQNGAGELVIGDSHEYGSEIEPFDSARIDELILDYLARFFDAQDMHVSSRWHGFYVKQPARAWVEAVPCDSVVVVTGLGGHGMTMSFGVAEDSVGRVLG